MSNGTAIKLRPDVVHTELESGSAVLLDLGTHKYFSLNETGAEIWQMLSSGSEPSQVASHLAEKFHIDITKAEKDVTGLIEKLKDAGLVEVS